MIGSILKGVGGLFSGGGGGDMLGRIGGALFGGGNRAVKRMGQGFLDARKATDPIYQGATERLNPYSGIGSEATGLIRSLLGFGGTPGQADYSAYLAANPDVADYFKKNPKALQQFGGDINKAAQYHYETFGRNEGRELPTSGGVSDTAGAEALTRFREGTGYRDTKNAALGGVTSSAAARGLLGSSGTGKTFQDTAARLAQGSFGDFLSQLTGQQRIGADAALAQSGLDVGYGDRLNENILGHAQTMSKKKGGGFLGKLFG